jgi:hypothetical protein
VTLHQTEEVNSGDIAEEQRTLLVNEPVRSSDEEIDRDADHRHREALGIIPDPAHTVAVQDRRVTSGSGATVVQMVAPFHPDVLFEAAVIADAP